tara:strand:- start:127 stop:639 length:513 start_codon:yes stop_codon:yes gene_type:complete
MTDTQLDPKFRRRIVKEIEKYNIKCELVDDRFLYIPLTLYEPLNKMAKLKNHDPALILTLKSYPFSVPKISYLSKNATSIYRTNAIFIEDIKIMSGIDCICCNSFVCPEMWTPGNTIKDIIDEFQEITKLKCRAIERLYCDKIQEQLINATNNGIKNHLSKDDLRIAEYL